MNRQLLATLGLLVLVVSSGCTGFGSVTSQEELRQNATYDWDTDANATITVEDGEYRAVYTIENRSTVRLYHSTAYGNDRPIDVRAVQFQYPNETVVGMNEISVEETRSEVYIHLPTQQGQLAFTSDTSTNNIQTRTFVDGSHEVVLPSGYRVENFVLGNVRPGGYETTTDDQNRVHIRWDDVSTDTISVQYYLARDVYLLGGIAVIASLGAAIGLAYVYRQIQDLRRRREEMGLDIDVEDDDSDGPPPGMR